MFNKCHSIANSNSIFRWAIEVLKYKVRRFEKGDSVCYAAMIITEKTEEKPLIVVFPNGDEMDQDAFKSYRKTLSQYKTDYTSYDLYRSGASCRERV